MTRRNLVALVVVLLCGAVVGGTVFSPMVPGGRSPAAYAGASGPDAPSELAALRGEVERLKNVVPDQAHAMQDVDYHFTNLWFAAQQSNWALAQFYFNEARSHLRWAVRIIPVRKDNQGKEVNLQNILEATENGPLKELEAAIEAQDNAKVVSAYEFTLTSCYGCHKASEKPYLRPRIPERPATTMINFDPNAPWPK